jgi:hypothetical protein
MRVLVGFLAFNAVLLVVGLGLLAAVRVVRPTPRALLAAAGAGLLAGAAVVGLASVALLTAGGQLQLPLVVAAAAVAAAALWLVAWRRERRPQPSETAAAPEPDRGDRVASLVLSVAVGCFILVQIVASRHVRAAWDAEHVWALKAVALVTGGLDSELFHARQQFSGAHLTYPILQPALGALLFRFSASAQAGLIVSELWLLVGALVFAAPALCGVRERRWLVLLPLALAACAAPTAGLLRGDADVLAAVFAALGALSVARWIHGGCAGYAVLAALALAASANVKQEGAAFAVAVLLPAVVVVLFTQRRRFPAAVAMAIGTGVLALPWWLWQRANGPFNADTTPASIWLNVGFLRDRLSQLDNGAQTLLNTLADTVGYLWLVPAFLALCIALVAGRRVRPLVALYGGAVVLSVLFVLWAYWTYDGPDPLGHISRTSIRTLTTTLFIAAAGLAHLLALTADVALRRRARERSG